MIDDNSSDSTVEVIKQTTKSHPRHVVKAFFHDRNVGRGGVVSEGIERAHGRVVGFIDVDLEISEQYIPAFYWKVEEGDDVVIARRSYEFTMQKLIRFAATKTYAFLVRQILKSPFRDTEAGYKFFKREKILPIIKRCHDKKWFWDTEVVMRSYLAGLKITELPVFFVRNAQKKSTVKVIPDSMMYLKKLIEFRNEIG